MAVMNQLDASEVERQLTEWLQRQQPAGRAAVSEVSIPQGSGGSAESVFMTARWTDADGSEHEERMVVRVMPQGPAVFPPAHYNFDAQYRVLDGLSRHTPVPVPPIRWAEHDPAVIGSPFLVMPFVPGRIPGDDPPFTVSGWVLELSPEDVGLMHDNGLRAVAELHRTDWEGLGLRESLTMPTYGAPGLDQILGFYEDFYRWAGGGRENPTLDLALRWLRANRPDQPARLRMCWGDARIGNMIFADDLSVAAVLDLETATLAAPEYDVAWLLILNRHHSEGLGFELPPGFPSEAEIVARYEELTGYHVQHLHYHEVLSCFRLSVMMVRVADLMERRGLLPAGNTMAIDNPASQLLAKALELPPPSSEGTTSFLGSLNT